MAALKTNRVATGLRRYLLPLFAVLGLLATSACYYGPYGYYGYPGYAYAPAPVYGGVVVGAYPHRYYWR